MIQAQSCGRYSKCVDESTVVSRAAGASRGVHGRRYNEKNKGAGANAEWHEGAGEESAAHNRGNHGNKEHLPFVGHEDPRECPKGKNHAGTCCVATVREATVPSCD